jgi:excisionase family DNA binding protein
MNINGGVNMNLKCTHCQTELSPTTKFCPECGTPKPEPVASTEEEKNVLTTYEAADFLRISRSKMYELVRKKQIPFKEVGIQKRFLRTQLIEWMQA